MVASADLGLALLSRVSWFGPHRAVLGGEFAVGYTATSAPMLRAEPTDRGSDHLTIPGMATGLGRLDLDGWNLRISLVAGF